MQVDNKTKKLYNFKNTCDNCFNDIEFPILGDFAEGEIMFQTKDGEDFYVAVLLGNRTLNFITNTLKQDKQLSNEEVNPQKILAFVADKPNNKELTADYPICPICKARQERYSDNIKTNKIEVKYASWFDFEKLSQENKIARIKKVGST